MSDTTHALAALIAPPTDGPALQWAHANADTRAPVLALLDEHARGERSAATLARMSDDIESAQAHEAARWGWRLRRRCCALLPRPRLTSPRFEGSCCDRVRSRRLMRWIG
jgi:hypothetical protein